MTNSLLPPNSSPFEKDIEAVTQRLEKIPTPLDTLWNPLTCHQRLLPWLAWALSVEEWDNEWSEEAKRQSIAQSVTIHRHKGSVSSIYRALKAAGYGNCQVFEGVDPPSYGQDMTYDGNKPYGLGSQWANYMVILTKPITIKQAAEVRRILSQIAPARCHLTGLDFEQALNLYNHTIYYDNTYTHGVA